ncbi:hypothetical protein C2G38_2068173 [Gigaspora rosea]|uniref:Uncharacterized protein n=1 Tax=Gigaspora rosea TaxID=44941 RepID=A0A397VYU4_9GLOM|nr:hypothetical protein C2G38_2068173 [Gigaspora rosea]
MGTCGAKLILVILSLFVSLTAFANSLRKYNDLDFKMAECTLNSFMFGTFPTLIITLKSSPFSKRSI